MRVLLVLDRQSGNARIVVHLKQKCVQEQVILLLEENRVQEAFDLLKRRAVFEAYLPEGAKLSTQPALTLIEDLL